MYPIATASPARTWRAKKQKSDPKINVSSMNEARSLSRQWPVRQEGNRVVSALRHVGYLFSVSAEN
ncbi:MAG: hypothetical protein DME41_07550 [Verrucomicrobia bacterium]|nr:MAG: hypothetical protein DME41_07550 [Verrucomicrobiota bacterium]